MSPLAKIETVHLADRTIEAIRNAIVTGELEPGAPLRDRQLAEMLGVSRTPVREALHRLEAAGLVESAGRSGWAVTQFTEQDVRELFQLRMVLEPLGLDALADDPDERRISRIVGFFADYEHPIAAADYTDYFKHDDDFHRAIIDCTDNQRIRTFYEVMNSHINRGRFFLYGATAGRVEETLDEHREIVAAVVARDFARAREALLSHLRTGEELMIRQLGARAAGQA